MRPGPNAQAIKAALAAQPLCHGHLSAVSEMVRARVSAGIMGWEHLFAQPHARCAVGALLVYAGVPEIDLVTLESAEDVDADVLWARWGRLLTRKYRITKGDITEIFLANDRGANDEREREGRVLRALGIS